MGWETRGNGIYYYQKRREGSRVVSEYVGTGPDAALIESLVQLGYDKAKHDRRQDQKQRAEVEAFDGEVAALCELIDMLTDAALVTAGFHKHKGQWRRKRRK